VTSSRLRLAPSLIASAASARLVPIQPRLAQCGDTGSRATWKPRGCSGAAVRPKGRRASTTGGPAPPGPRRPARARLARLDPAGDRVEGCEAAHAGAHHGDAFGGIVGPC